MSKGPIYSEDFYNQSPHALEQLEKNAREYPFSSIANFLLLYHYKKNAHAGFDQLAKKTALHFNNIHWLQLQLNEKFSADELTENFVAVIDKVEAPQEIEEVYNDSSDEIISTQDYPAEIKEFIQEDDPIAISQIENNTQAEKSISNETINDIIQTNSAGQTQVTEAITTPEPIIIPALQSEGDVAADDEDIIAFEPLHTVDYFASQGIKINDELITNDKLGSQMKSFTAWLKSMKKLHPGRLAEQNVATEKLIQTAAEESNVNTEVLTEAMAEVLIKQDKKEKAIEMFSKLSLINPSKSAYFAAKIESIKSS